MTLVNIWFMKSPKFVTYSGEFNSYAWDWGNR